MRLPKTLALVAILSILCVMTKGNTETTQTEQKLSNQEPGDSPGIKHPELKGVTFEAKSALDGLTKEHFRFSSEIWEASDGIPVFLRREYYDSPKNAEKALREAVKTAIAIFETPSVKNRNRKATGKRVVAHFDKERPQHRVIYWIDGVMLYSVESPSFAHALLFEKMFPRFYYAK